MIVFGLMGRIGSGKGTVADILIKEYDFKSITMGDLVREEVKERGLEPTREETTKVSVECRTEDPAYFIKKAIKKIKESGHERWLIDGIRTPLDVNEFRKAFPHIKFIRVDVDPITRFERMKKRGRPGFPDTYSKFMDHERLEDKKFNLNETLSHADHVIDNNNSYEDLKEKSHELINELL